MFPEGFLVTDRIDCQTDIGSKKRVLEQLGKLLSNANPELTQDLVFDALLDRERLGSTGLGQGIALPHARMRQVEQPIGAFVQLATSVDFDAIDDQPVDMAFALLVPESATESHLQLLAGLAAMFSDNELTTKLRAARSPETIYQHICRWEAARETA